MNKLICLYDDNRIVHRRAIAITFTEDGKRFEAYGWQVLRVEEGNSVEAVAAPEEARAGDRPYPRRGPTEIGYGSPHKQGRAESHSALCEDEFA